MNPQCRTWSGAPATGQRLLGMVCITHRLICAICHRLPGDHEGEDVHPTYSPAGPFAVAERGTP